ncbi:MAG: ABC transporter substrate-binding protein [Acetobacteraceae bacterium]|nr:ABC transporter substrate-binding protein [Acetobacteraceae bacterium]
MRRILLAAACGLTALLAGAPPTEAQTLRIALRQDLDSLDPALATTYVSRIVYAGLCDKLLDINEKLEIVPQLATSWEWADDKTLVLHLRAGVTFQNGEPLDAAAVKYTLERYLTMTGSFRRSELAAIDHVEVVDPATVRIALKAPSGAFLAQLTDRSGMILPPKATEAAGRDFGAHPVCSGPFRFAERVAQDHVTLEKFPQYWNAAAIHFDRVTYQVLTDSSVRLANLKAGTVDIAEYVLPTDTAAVKADPHLRLVVSDALGYFSITNNLANGPAADNPYGKNALMRQALDLAIDRRALVNVVFNDMYIPTAQAVPPASPFYDPAVKVAERNVDKAKALLKQAGVTLPVKLDLLAYNEPDIMQAAEVIQSMAAEAGFDVKIQAMEFASSLQASQRGEYQAYMIGWSGRVDIDGNIYAFLHSGQGNNIGHYSNPTVDRLLDEGRGNVDLAKRQAAYNQMWPELQKDLPMTFLWTPRNIAAMSSKISGYRAVPDGLIRLQGLEMAK